MWNFTLVHVNVHTGACDTIQHEITDHLTFFFMQLQICVSVSSSLLAFCQLEQKLKNFLTLKIRAVTVTNCFGKIPSDFIVNQIYRRQAKQGTDACSCCGFIMCRVSSVCRWVSPFTVVCHLPCVKYITHPQWTPKSCSILAFLSIELIAAKRSTFVTCFITFSVKPSFHSPDCHRYVSCVCRDGAR